MISVYAQQNFNNSIKNNLIPDLSENLICDFSIIFEETIFSSIQEPNINLIKFLIFNKVPVVTEDNLNFCYSNNWYETYNLLYEFKKLNKTFIQNEFDKAVQSNNIEVINLFRIPIEYDLSGLQTEPEYNTLLLLSQLKNVKLFTKKNIYSACFKGWFLTATFLYEKNNNDILDKDNIYLIYSCVSGNIKLVKYFITKNIKITGNELMYACESGNIMLVKFLIEEYNFKFSKSLLINTCISGNLQLFQYLHMLIQDLSGDELYHACVYGNFEIAEYLTKNFKSEMKISSSILTNTINSGNPKLIDFIIENYPELKK